MHTSKPCCTGVYLRYYLRYYLRRDTPTSSQPRVYLPSAYLCFPVAHDFFHGFNIFSARVAQGSNAGRVCLFLYSVVFPFLNTSTMPRRTSSANRSVRVVSDLLFVINFLQASVVALSCKEAIDGRVPLIGKTCLEIKE